VGRRATGSGNNTLPGSAARRPRPAYELKASPAAKGSARGRAS